MKKRGRGFYIRLGVLAVLVLAPTLSCLYMLVLPGASAGRDMPALAAREAALAAPLEADVRALAVDIGERNLAHPEALARAASWVAAAFADAGYEPHHEPYEARGVTVENIWIERPGGDLADELVVVGAHYDSALTTPGADDNGSGVAALLAIARAFADSENQRTIRFVAFVNEEPPHFQSERMGSLVHARGLADAGADVVAMLSLETMGFYREAEGTQAYPFPLSAFFPATGDFLGFVSDLGSRDLLHRSVATFREHASLPSEGAALPADIPGVDWSDHWSFWQFGYPGVMVTDTAPFRNPHYHEPTDVPEEVDYERLARAVAGIEKVVVDLANGERP